MALDALVEKKKEGQTAATGRQDHVRNLPPRFIPLPWVEPVFLARKLNQGVRQLRRGKGERGKERGKSEREHNPRLEEVGRRHPAVGLAGGVEVRGDESGELRVVPGRLSQRQQAQGGEQDEEGMFHARGCGHRSL